MHEGIRERVVLGKEKVKKEEVGERVRRVK